MKGHKIARLAMALLMDVALALPGVSVMAADAPPNDNFANANVISSLPYYDTVTNTGATEEPGEPQSCFYYAMRTVWYSITPETDGVLMADMSGSNLYETALAVYRAVGPGFEGLSSVGCTIHGTAQVVFNVQAGTTYYLQAGTLQWSEGGILQVNVQVIPPPPNDDWANAQWVSSLPFDDSKDMTGATQEVGEPTPSCVGSTPARTVWYAFTPQETKSVSVYISLYETVVAAYTGNSVSNLIEATCRAYEGWMTFRAEAGTTYYFQVARLYGGWGWSSLHIEATPPPVASFYFGPSDPSVFDPIQFYDNSWDPIQIGIQSRLWDLGDGTMATDCCPTHKYASDGDYTVNLTVTTPDGRTASTSQVVRVKTHDVAIVRLGAPQSASAGQTRRVTVDIKSNRYEENVRVELLKSIPGGFQSVGMLTMFVPIRPSNRTTQFDFSYTFTADDARMGKVTFRAAATIIDARDVLPADNEAISSPTKVGR